MRRRVGSPSVVSVCGSVCHESFGQHKVEIKSPLTMYGLVAIVGDDRDTHHERVNEDTDPRSR